MKTLEIAKMCHAINTAYRLSLGDHSQLNWENAGEAHQQSLLASVEFYLAKPEATPEQSHETWYQQKQAEGWKYGLAKDVEKKEHPNFLTFAELAPEQKVKEFLFRATVHLMQPLHDQEEFINLSNQVSALSKQNKQLKTAASAKNTAQNPKEAVEGGILIKYIGSKDTYSDNLYDSLLIFEKDQVRLLPSDLAMKLLQHAEFIRLDSAEQGIEVQAKVDDTDGILVRSESNQQLKLEQENVFFEEINQIERMSKEGLLKYAFEKYQQQLSIEKTVEELKSDVKQMLMIYGLV